MNEPHQYSEQDVEDALMRNAYAEGRADERAEWLPVLEALKEVFSLEHSLLRDIYGSEFVESAVAAIASVEGKS